MDESPVNRSGFVFSSFVSSYIPFCLVGLSGAIIDSSVLVVFYRDFGTGLILSKIIASEVAIVSNFIFNNWVTFRNFKSAHRIRDRFLRFQAIYVLSIAVSCLLLKCLFHLGFSLLVANILTIGGMSLVNYFLVTRNCWSESPRTLRQ